MKRGFYRKMALNNLRMNYRFYVPRILSEAGLIGCFYIALTLAMDERLSKVKGGSYIPMFMAMGTLMLALLSVILMLYTNSFLMKQRRREFGLYNILGMEKKHVGRVLLHESLLSSGVSIALGLMLGVLFYKVCSLLICKLLKAQIVFGFYFITPKTLIPAGLFFLLTDLAIYAFNRVSLARMNIVDLLHSASTGEREPKVKWLLLLLGILTLGGGYALSLRCENSVDAMLSFFPAVFLVIFGTYFLFVTGSVFVLKTLKKNPRYYYNKRHMPSVSGLLYRMKQNAVGLASIAILATCVLVMISTTVSLYTGMQEMLTNNFPQHLYLNVWGRFASNEEDLLENALRDAAADNGVQIVSIEGQDFLEISFLVDGNVLSDDLGSANLSDTGKVANFAFITQEMYNRLTGEDLSLQENAIAVARITSDMGNIHVFEKDIILHGKTYTVAAQLPLFPVQPEISNAVATYGVVVSDEGVLDDICRAQQEAYGEYASGYTTRFGVTYADLNAAAEAGDEMIEAVTRTIENNVDNEAPFSYRFDTYWEARENMLGMYGTLLFLGILLGAVCLFATALIIFYKQISEGYEDRRNFQIMQKVGMSKKEVRGTISSQLLLVFFLPLGVALIHLAAASPMLLRMLSLMMLADPKRFLLCAAATFAVFALVYTLIYTGTSKTYYKIVK